MSNKKLNIGVLTATRAEYGLLQNIIKQIDLDPDSELYLYVTGTHLSEQYGFTIQEIKNDGFPIYETIDILTEGDDTLDIIQSSANALQKFGQSFSKFKPDLLIILGDRYELLPIADAAINFHIPLIHIGGGEITEGAIDEMVRHAITKLSLLHFPSCELYRHRIIQMGENPERVFNLGDTGVENALSLPKLSNIEIENRINLNLEKPFWLVTFHPETIAGPEKSLEAQKELLAALDELIKKDQQIVFTGVNADEGGKRLHKQLIDWAKDKPLVKLNDSLGSILYINLMRRCKAVIGNSSSGIIEAPAVDVPTINIGNRQKGRMKTNSILTVDANKDEIFNAIMLSQDISWQLQNLHQTSPFYKVDAARNIFLTIKEYFKEKDNSFTKTFYDLNF